MEPGALKELRILIRGAGEMASGVACTLYRANLRRILMLEFPSPLAVRRRVAFCEAVYDERMSVEGIEAERVVTAGEIEGAWASGRIAVRVDPAGASIRELNPDVLIDATLAKRNPGLTAGDAPLVIALGPGFEAGTDCHFVVETNRGHDLGRLIASGAAAPDTGIPAEVGGYDRERVLRAPAAGVFVAARQLGDPVVRGELVGRIGEAEVRASIDGVLRGLIRPGAQVNSGLKIGDIDPRGEAVCCDTVSDKARTLGGAVLECILGVFNR